MNQKNDLKNFALSFDKKSKLSDKDCSAIEANLRDDEELLYVARTDVLIGAAHGPMTSGKEAAAVLTDSRFFYVNAKSSPLEISSPTPCESISLDDVNGVKLEMAKGIIGKTPYVTMLVGEKAYRLALPKNQKSAEESQTDWNTIVRIFEDARTNYASEREAAQEPPCDAGAITADDYDEAFVSRSIPYSDGDLDRLERLALLRDRGIITEEEFQTKKKEILGI